MNTAAATAFTLVMLLGTGGLTWLVARMRNTPTTATDITPPSTVWDQTVHALGNPQHIDLDPPACPPWPTWHTITRHDRVAAAITTEH